MDYINLSIKTIEKGEISLRVKIDKDQTKKCSRRNIKQ